MIAAGLREKSEHNDSLLESVLNSSHAGIMVFESVRDEDQRIKDFRWVLANHAASDIIGKSNSWLKGKLLLEVLGDHEGCLFNEYSQVVESGLPFETQQHYSLNGNEYWFTINAEKFNDGFILTFTDITNFKTSQQLLQQVFDSTPSGIMTLDSVRDNKDRIMDFTITSLNKLAIDFAGSDITGERLLESFPLVGINIFPQFVHVVESGEVVRFEHRRTADDRWYLVQANRNNDGLTLTFDDITELKAAQEKLKRANIELEHRVDERTKELSASEQKFRSLAESLPQLVWSTTPQGLGDYFNKNWYRYTGQTSADSCGWGWTEAIHPDDRERTIDAWIRTVRTGVPFDIEYRIRRNDGVYRWFLARGVPAMENGEILKWAGTCTDIHERRLMQEKNDEFIGIASHELKTPLTSIKAYIQLVRRNLETKGDNDSALYVKKTEQHISRLTQLISDLLDVSKIQAGKLNYNMAEFDFDEMLRETIESVQHTSPKHKIIFESSVKVKYFGDRLRLEQVVNNFLTNAVKYSPKADKVIVSSELSDGNIVVSVKDFGIGIPYENLSKLFDRFFRVDNTASRYEGLGLGLYISSEILKRHNGSFWIESEVGKGSTFYFLLPTGDSPLSLKKE